MLWDTLDEDYNGQVNCFSFFDSRSGPELYAGGKFNRTNDAGLFIGNGLAKWDGNTWSSVGGGVIGGAGAGLRLMSAHSMCQWDDGTGNALYVGGNFDYSVTASTAFDTRGIVKAVLCSKPVCLADLTGDGLLDFFDVSAFLDAFGAHEPTADFTEDGIYNFFDVSEFLDSFGQGCP